MIQLARFLEKHATNFYLSQLARQASAHGDIAAYQADALARANNAIVEAREYAADVRVRYSQAKAQARAVLAAAQQEAERVRTGATL